MEKYINILNKCPLFQTISDSDILHILRCFNIQERTYKADSYIFLQNDVVNYIGIIISGQIAIVKESLSGNRHIINELSTSNLFGETIACTKQRISPVHVYTKTDCTVLLMPYENITHSCTSNCGFHTRLIQNMMIILGEKNLHLNKKLDLLMIKGMREKISSYLYQIYEETGSLNITLPFNRNELAEYLNVSRTSMSRELTKMKEDHIIDFHLNQFRILSLDNLIRCMEESA